jgi:hypothetical protein
MELLESDWLAMHGATSLDVSQEVVRKWLAEMGFTDEYAQYRKVGNAAVAGAAPMDAGASVGGRPAAGGAGASARASEGKRE